MKKIVLIAMLVLFLGACTVTDKPAAQASNEIVHTTYGGFVMQTHAITKHIITPEMITREVYSFDGNLTESEKLPITAEEYQKIKESLELNSFSGWDPVYEEEVPIADIGNVNITYNSKTVQIYPNAPDYMPQQVKDVLDTIHEIIYNTGSTQIFYQPMQCERTPWEQWYSEGNIQYIREPTDEELIVDYYSQEHSIAVSDAAKILSEDIEVCEACGVCPKAYHFTAKIASEEFEEMVELGWE